MTYAEFKNLAQALWFEVALAFLRFFLGSSLLSFLDHEAILGRLFQTIVLVHLKIFIRRGFQFVDFPGILLILRPEWLGSQKQ